MENPKRVLTQEVGALTDANSHISFIQQMLTKYVVSEQRKQTLIEKLKVVEHRVNDPGLHLAVLGEFSSGKSTFINALLRHRLLKSARVATTASATYVSYGPTLEVAATFVDGQCVRGSAWEISELHRAIADIKSSPVEVRPIRELIDLLTTDQDVANRVQRVDIALPNKNLQSGLSIIDTPGIGAGAAYTNQHMGITQAVVENSADAAIVLIPAAQPMSSTLISFLQTIAHRFLHRCIFVVTAMDTQDDVHRETTLSFVRQCLTEKLGLRSPMVCECAAITALPLMGTLPAYRQATWVYWQQQFAGLESVVLKEMVRQRSLIISETLIYLLRAIFVELSTDMQERQKVIAASAQALEKNSVAAIEGVLEKALSEGGHTIRLQSNKCRINVNARKSELRSRLRTNVHALINEASWDVVNKYSSVVEPRIKQAVEAQGQAFLSAINHDINLLQRSFEEVSNRFQRQFEQSYSTLSALGGHITIPASATASIRITPSKFSSAVSFIEQVHSEDKQRAGKGAAIGAVIGIPFGGPLGMAAGAAIGSVIGLGSGNDLETCREGVKSRVNGDIDRYVDQVVSEVVDAVETFKQRAILDFRRIVEAHLREYGSAVASMQQQHRQKESQLALKAQDIARDMRELERRQNQLKTLNEKILRL